MINKNSWFIQTIRLYPQEVIVKQYGPYSLKDAEKRKIKVDSTLNSDEYRTRIYWGHDNIK